MVLMSSLQSGDTEITVRKRIDIIYIYFQRSLMLTGQLFSMIRSNIFYKLRPFCSPSNKKGSKENC